VGFIGFFNWAFPKKKTGVFVFFWGQVFLQQPWFMEM